MHTFAINGFGRIGRLACRAWFRHHQDEFQLAAINTSGSMDLYGWFQLLKHDTTYGPFPAELSYEEHQSKDEVSDQDPLLGYLIIDRHFRLPILAQRDPAKLPWSKYAVETVLESTGVFRTAEKASLHLTAGAKYVVISAPGKGEGIRTSVIGVNADSTLSKDHELYDNASCTTNCVAPVASIISSHLGVKKAAMTTIHAITDGQNTQDGSHKDLRRARAASQNLVPTTTGAAIATTRVVPELKGLFDGVSLRNPVLTGSLVDFTFIVKKPTSVQAVNALLTQESKSSRYQGILAVTDEPLVSSDIIGRRESSIIDLNLTQVIDGDLVKIFSWYDNEWGYANRLVETALELTHV